MGDRELELEADLTESMSTEASTLACPACRYPGFGPNGCSSCGYMRPSDGEELDAAPEPRQPDRGGPDLILSDDGDISMPSAAFEPEAPRTPAPEARPRTPVPEATPRTPVPDAPDPLSPDAMGYAACPRCSHPSDGARRCALCGYPLRFGRQKKKAGEPKRCRNCGMRNEASEPVCINCGSRL